MTQFNVIFKNLNKFFFEGEKVQVKLEVNNERSCTVSSIVASFIGSSSYICNDSSQNNMKSKFFTKTTSETYFDEIISLFAAKDKESSVWMPGIQVFAFEYQLPKHLPSSIESSLGYVRYALQIIADVEGETIQKTEYFSVVSKTDISKDTYASSPGIIWRPETQCFLQALVCKNGAIRAFVHLEKKGYVPGEYISINAEICNFNRFPVEWVKATLVQYLKFRGSKSFEEKRIVAEIVRGCILATETQTWRSESMLIPGVPPSSFPPKKLIRVKYRLLLQFKPSWKRFPIELGQKIIIGTVHLVECNKGEEQGQGEGEEVYKSEFFNNSNLEPCIFGPHTIEENGQVSTFSPLYPVYVTM